MSNDVVVRGPQSALAFTDEQTGWTPAQLSTLEQLGVSGASEGDLAVFFHQATRTGLDPFAKQIYMIGRWSSEGTKWTIQTGIDGYRLIARRAAERTHETLEYEDTLWCGPDGQWRDVWVAQTPPAAARVTVLRNGGRFPAIALWNEYVQTKRDGSPTQMWASRGAGQLAKCAEALALRKAFPQDLSGIYTEDEMGQADSRAEQAQAGPGPSATTTRVTPPRAGQRVVDGQAAQPAADEVGASGLDCAGWQARIAEAATVDACRVIWREAGSERDRDCGGELLSARILARIEAIKVAEEAAAVAAADAPDEVPEGVGEPIAPPAAVDPADGTMEAPLEGEVLDAPAAEPEADPEELRRPTGRRRALLTELVNEVGSADARDSACVLEFGLVVEDVSTTRLQNWLTRLQQARAAGSAA